MRQITNYLYDKNYQCTDRCASHISFLLVVGIKTDDHGILQRDIDDPGNGLQFGRHLNQNLGGQGTILLWWLKKRKI
jgi:hypothetical protein